ncbi:MAG: DNA polymerase IV [Desulfobulbus sp.]
MQPNTAFQPPISKIIHIDMDAFYASIEQRDQPALRGRPVVVGGAPGTRGVVAACSYEARRYGIHSAMPSSRAYRLCPQAVFLRPRMEYYREISREIMGIFHSYTPLVEPLSVDEAFLDVTCNLVEEPSATRLAQSIRTAIREATGLTASAGVSYNKFLAKIASAQNKPDGLTVIAPDQAKDFLASLPIGKFYGVGRVTEQKMHDHGIRTGSDLLRFSQEELTRLFGKTGRFFYEIARGRDIRPVTPVRVRKSLGAETTFQEDIYDSATINAVLRRLVERVVSGLAHARTGGRTLSLKVRYSDFTTITRSHTSIEGFFSADDILHQLPRLLAATEAGKRKIRLLGISVSNLGSRQDLRPPGPHQLPLPFPAASDQAAARTEADFPRSQPSRKTHIDA